MTDHPIINSSTEINDETINLIDLIRVIAQNRILIFKICTVSAFLSVCCALSLSNVYTATSTCYPPQKESPLGSFATMISQTNPIMGLGGLGGPSDLYLAIIKSRSVADAVVKRLDLQNLGNKTVSLEKARNFVTKSVKFSVGKDGIITVVAKNKDPQKAALIANTFVNEMIRRSILLYSTKAGTERNFLETRLEKAKAELKFAENTLKDFQEKYKTVKADTQASAAIEGIARLRAELVSKEVQLAALRNSMTDQSSEVKTLQAAISKLTAQLGAQSGSGGGANIIPSAGNLPSISVQYLHLMRELKVQEAIFEQLSRQYELSKINETKDSSSVQIIDEAVVPTLKSGPKRSLIVILSTLSAFILSLTVIFIKEFLNNLPPEKAKLLAEIKYELLFWKRHT